jgi:1-deoxy-D-xylulose-5-phosphate reductoisomerase
MRRITLLGSTGSIGRSTLDVVRQNRHRFEIFALIAGRNLDLLVDQIREFQPHAVAVSRTSDVDKLAGMLREAGLKVPFLTSGDDSYAALTTAPECDFVMSAIVGVAGLHATYEAVKCGKRIGLANKETLVAAGSLVMAAVTAHGTELIPVDSEHNGAHQCLRAGRREDATKLILTASGGPFRTTPREDLEAVEPNQALNHPTWQMGPRITIDSATLMNKGFEVIEACWLFGFPPSQVEVVVHPQSTVHAMVEYNDGSVIAQVCATDMRMPIQYAMTYPERSSAPVPRLDWSLARNWEFHAPDFEKFPLLRLAYEAQETGGTAGCTLNAADEVAVEAFLQGEISFPGIARVVEKTMERVPARRAASIAEVLESDRHSREVARSIVAETAGARVSVAAAKSLQG